MKQTIARLVLVMLIAAASTGTVGCPCGPDAQCSPGPVAIDAGAPFQPSIPANTSNASGRADAGAVDAGHSGPSTAELPSDPPPVPPDDTSGLYVTLVPGLVLQHEEDSRYSQLRWRVLLLDGSGNPRYAKIQRAAFEVRSPSGALLANPITGQPMEAVVTSTGSGYINAEGIQLSDLQSSLGAPAKAHAVGKHCDAVVLIAEVVVEGAGTHRSAIRLDRVNPNSCF